MLSEVMGAPATSTQSKHVALVGPCVQAYVVDPSASLGMTGYENGLGCEYEMTR